MAGHQLSATILRTYHPEVVPLTELEREAVRNLLERILLSAAFRNSKRYASVLRHIVERALEGNDFQLKERSIGIEDTGELRIELQPGSYVPQFLFAGENTLQPHPPRPAPAEIKESLGEPATRTRKLSSSSYRLTASAVLLIAVLAMAPLTLQSEGPLQRFWGPLLSARGQVQRATV